MRAAEDVLSYRYPMQDMEIENGGQLTVRESQLALFVNEGRIADVLGPGLHTLNTRNSARPDRPDELEQGLRVALQVGRVLFLHAPRDRPEVGHAGRRLRRATRSLACIRLRAFGNYAYRIADPRKFFTEVAGTREEVFAADLEGQLRTMIVARMTAIFANSEISFVDMAANLGALADKVAARREAESLRRWVWS
jgi:membrane protease subunit (stomatin/prohibitin family)